MILDLDKIWAMDVPKYGLKILQRFIFLIDSQFKDYSSASLALVLHMQLFQGFLLSNT